MKKIIALLLAILMIVGVFAACSKPSGENPNTDPSNKDNIPNDDLPPENGGEENGPNDNLPVIIPEGINGTELAKLMLANERLNSQLLKNNGDIFENGEEVFENLAAIANDNLVKYSYQDAQNTSVLSVTDTGKSKLVPLSSAGVGRLKFLPLASQKYQNSDGSYVEVDGNTYKWKNFAEYSNSYDYFKNLTAAVVSSAESGAELINNIKKYVRVVDKWVNMGGVKYFLHVEDNLETLFELRDDQLSMCMRYKNADGSNVYELYISNSTSKTRMHYIPGEKYEYSHQSTVGEFNHNFLAENKKGFWEVVDVGKMPTHYNVSCMVLKNDICYDSFYDPTTGTINLLKVISADRKTDIMYIAQYDQMADITLMLQAFDGIEHIELNVSADKVSHLETPSDDAELLYHDHHFTNAKIYQTTGRTNPTIVLSNGTAINNGDSFLDSKITISSCVVSHFNKEDGDGYMPQLSLRIQGNTYEERMDTLLEFFKLTGLTCRRDMQYIEAGIIQANAELAEFTKYHEWNESPISTNEALDQGYSNGLAKFAAYEAMYNEIKDAEVLNFEDKEIIELNIKFAPISSQSSTTVKAEKMTVSVTDLSLSIDDVTLLVENEPYMVNFALVNTANGSSGLNHITLSDHLTTVYTGEKSFKVTQTASFEIPVLDFGEYTVVVYISTSDGIRVSGYVPLNFTEVVASEDKQENVSIATRQNDTGGMIVSYVEIKDVEVSIELPESGYHSYATMYDALAKEAYEYGFAAEGALVEIFSAPETEPALEGETATDPSLVWTPLLGTEEMLASGTYRLKYNVKNGDFLVEGYVYTSYSAPEINEPDTPSEDTTQDDSKIPSNTPSEEITQDDSKTPSDS